MKQSLKVLGLVLCVSFLSNAQSEVPQPQNLKSLVYDFKSKKLTGELPFDQFSYLLVKDGKNNFLKNAFIYEIEYVKIKDDKKVKCDATKKISDSLNLQVPDVVYKGAKRIRRPIFKQEYSTKIDTLEFNSMNDLKCFLKYYNNPIKIKKKNELGNGKIQMVFVKGVFKPLHKLELKPVGPESKDIKAIIPPLEPSKLYEIVISKRLNNEQLTILFQYFDKYMKESILHDEPIVESAELEKFYNEKIYSLEKRLDRTVNVTIFPKKHSVFRDSILLKDLKHAVDTGKLPVINILDQSFYPTNELIVEVGKKLKNEELDFNSFSNWLTMFINQEQSEIDKVFKGLNFPKSKSFDFNKRAENLKANIDSLNLLKLEFEKVRTTDSSDSVEDFYQNFLILLIDCIKDNEKATSKYNKHVLDSINSRLGVSELLSISTEGNSLKTSNSKTLIPDFGFVNAFAHDSRGKIRYLARPYFGLNYHFRGINKEQKLGEIIDRDFRHRFSLSIGVTIGKIDTPQYTDLFNGISPMLGLNYKLTRQIRFGVGTLFLREKDFNPINDETTVQIAPYASVSLDFGLFEQVGKLVGKVF